MSAREELGMGGNERATVEPKPSGADHALHLLPGGKDGIARIVYDAPRKTVNALEPRFADELTATISALEADPSSKGAILVSGKGDSWIVGADIAMLRNIGRADEAEAMAKAGQQALARLHACRKPIVAAIHGPALGGGFEVALACHGRVLTDDRRTKLGFPEVQLGLLPAMNGLERLAERAGLGVALECGLNGKPIDLDSVRRLGIADDVVPKPVLEAAAMALVNRLCTDPRSRRQWSWSFKEVQKRIGRFSVEKTPMGRSMLFKTARARVNEKTGCHYPAPGRIIDVLQAYASGGSHAASELSARAFGELAVSNVARHLMDLFLGTTALKKEPGVDVASVPARRVEDVVVIGAGLMGSGIAHAALQAGLHVRLKDRDDVGVARGLRMIVSALDEQVARKRMSARERDQRLGMLTAGLDDSGLATADLVLEAVFEDLSVKQRVLREAERYMKPTAIFASNTSSIPIDQIAQVARCPERVLGMHYFSPVKKMRLLEIVRGARTDPEAVATAVEVGKRQGKTVIVVSDGPGFYTTRVLASYLNEASWLLAEGVLVDEIDRALVDWGWPVGPLALVDEIGIDVAGHVMSVLQGALGVRFESPAVLARLLSDGRQGRKNERGFYLYGPARKTVGPGQYVDGSVYAAIGRPMPSISPVPSPLRDEIWMRCVLQLVNEAFYCLGERVLRADRDGDVGAVLGIGFPPFRGGPFHFARDFGMTQVVSRLRRYQEASGSPRFTPAPLLLEMAQANGRVCA